MTLEEQQTEHQQEAETRERAAGEREWPSPARPSGSGEAPAEGARATNGSEDLSLGGTQPRPGGAGEAPAEGAREPFAPEEQATQQAQPSERSEPQATPDLAAELEREREKATDYMNRWQRAQADLANYKRRTEQEREQDHKYGLAPLFLELLKMQDNFYRAFDTLPVELREFSWVQGVALTYAHLDGLLRLYGVTPIETKPGEPFDPASHEAVTHEETDAYPDGTLTAEYQRGHRLHDRVLRPALVRVAKAKGAEPTNQTS